MVFRKINPELLNIVRTEYSLELRANNPLAGLVPRIAVNIDNLLTKYDKISNVNSVQEVDDDNYKQAAAINSTVVRKNPVKKDMQANFCPGCYSLPKTRKPRGKQNQTTGNRTYKTGKH